MTNKPAPIDLSIIITAHSEGLIAHKTLLSIHAATKLLKKEGISYEIIASLDNPDEETLDYFKYYKKSINPLVRIINVSFRDLSSSRNNAVLEASGKIISFLDADDLVSKNWLIEGYRLAAASERVIVHPQFSITFGDDNLMWQKRDSLSLTGDTLALIDNNLWDSPSIARREIFISHPYHPNGNGLGYEDKHFNAQTLAAGISHKVANETLLFVRRKVSGSMLRQATSDLVTVAKNSLMSYDAINALELGSFLSNEETMPQSSYKHVIDSGKREAKRIAAKVHHQAKRYDIYLHAIQPLREKRQARILASLQSRYPKWMLDSWREIHKIDNQIFPGKELLKHLPWYNAENIRPGLRYTQLVQSFSQKPDTLFFVPHIIKGGADMLFINYSAELKKMHSGWNIAMLQTEAKESVWRDKLSNDIDFVNLYDLFKEFDLNTQYRLLATLVTQNDIRRIIIGNSQLAYDFVSRYQTLITNLDIAVYCFAFGEEFDEEGRLWGHIHTGIPRIYPVIHRIITDNENTVNKLEQEYAFDRKRFAVHYQPTSAEVKTPHLNNHMPLKVLWASRVCKQKRPDILKAVSNTLDPSEFQFDAYGQLEEGLTPDYFSDSRVNYKGPFNGSASLPTDKYDAFLYTSEGDGVPNVLQEMTAAGLPIVASNVGGIREFVMTDKTGLLIEDHEVIKDYTNAIKQLQSPDLRLKLSNGAQELLSTRFAHETWKQSLKRDFDR